LEVCRKNPGDVRRRRKKEGTMTEIRVPLGELVSEATIGRWFRSRDSVGSTSAGRARDRQVTIEVPAPAAGVLSTGGQGRDTVAVGALLGQIKDGAGAAPAQDPPRPRSKSRRRPRPPKSAAPDTAPSCRRLSGKRIDADVRVRQTAAYKGECWRRSSARGVADAGAQPARAVQMRAPSPADDPPRRRVKMTRLPPDHRAPASRTRRTTAAMLTTFQRGRHEHVMALRNQYKICSRRSTA